MGSWLFRADAGVEIGAGHVLRCLALGQVLRRIGHTPVFAMASAVPRLEARIQSEGMEFFRLSAAPGTRDDAEETKDLARRKGASWIVADGYHFDAAYQRRLKESGPRLLFLDDNAHCGHYPADAVLNQNLHAHPALYASRKSYTRLLLGTRYTLLRREFLSWKDWTREIPGTVRRILITLGGSDPRNVTLKVIQAIQGMDARNMEVAIVAGPVNPNLEDLRNEISGSTRVFRLFTSVENMPELMAWADMAVSGGGSTCWEMAFMGLPALLFVLAENQVPIAEGLDAKGASLNLGRPDELSPAEIGLALERLGSSAHDRQKMSRRGRELVDGGGASRVLKELNAYSLSCE